MPSLEKERQKIENNFKKKALEEFDVFDDHLTVYEMAKFIAFIMGYKREELAEKLEMDLYTVRYIYSKIGIKHYEDKEPIINRVRTLGYNSIFHYFCENYDDFSKPKDELETGNHIIYTYVRRCVNILRRVWYGYDENKVKRLWKGDDDEQE